MTAPSERSSAPKKKVPCIGCQHPLKIAPRLIGRKIKCHHCGQISRVLPDFTLAGIELSPPVRRQGAHPSEPREISARRAVDTEAPTLNPQASTGSPPFPPHVRTAWERPPSAFDDEPTGIASMFPPLGAAEGSQDEQPTMLSPHFMPLEEVTRIPDAAPFLHQAGRPDDPGPTHSASSALDRPSIEKSPRLPDEHRVAASDCDRLEAKIMAIRAEFQARAGEGERLKKLLADVDSIRAECERIVGEWFGEARPLLSRDGAVKPTARSLPRRLRRSKRRRVRAGSPAVRRPPSRRDASTRSIDLGQWKISNDMSYPDGILLKRRRTKIVATLGPSSSEPALIERLIAAGVDVFRLNMSHGNQEGHRVAAERVRAAAARSGSPIALLADLCGPKIRVGRFPEGKIGLVAGNRVVVTVRDIDGAPGLIPSQYAELARDVKPGDRILLDDGILELRVEAVEGTEIPCTVINGGVLKDNKGMNLPGVDVSAPALTEKDREDAAFALEVGVDFLALSFVQKAADVEELKALIAASGRPAHIIAKIETASGLENIDEILDAADALMVARGDLGAELPPEVVPIAQRRLVAKARAKSKPVIVATQMLESMIVNPRPTRAEVSDVSTAVYSGADAVMLSAETASGAHPLLAVEMMNRVARQIEGDLWTDRAFELLSDSPADVRPLPLPVALARSIAQLSRDLRVHAVVVFTRSGATAAVVAAAHPAAPVLALTTDAQTARQMNLLWGVIPLQVAAGDVESPNALARSLSRDLGLASPGDFILAITGFAATQSESEPAITVLRV